MATNLAYSSLTHWHSKRPRAPSNKRKLIISFSFSFIGSYDIIIPSYLPCMSVSGFKYFTFKTQSLIRPNYLRQSMCHKWKWTNLPHHCNCNPTPTDNLLPKLETLILTVVETQLQSLIWWANIFFTSLYLFFYYFFIYFCQDLFQLHRAAPYQLTGWAYKLMMVFWG